MNTSVLLVLRASTQMWPRHVLLRQVYFIKSEPEPLLKSVNAPQTRQRACGIHQLPRQLTPPRVARHWDGCTCLAQPARVPSSSAPSFISPTCACQPTAHMSPPSTERQICTCYVAAANASVPPVIIEPSNTTCVHAAKRTAVACTVHPYAPCIRSSSVRAARSNVPHPEPCAKGHPGSTQMPSYTRHNLLSAALAQHRRPTPVLSPLSIQVQRPEYVQQPQSVRMASTHAGMLLPAK